MKNCCDKLGDAVQELFDLVAAMGNVAIAYASDDTGTDFSLTDSTDKCFIGFTVTSNDPPVVGDFVGKWINFCGPQVASVTNVGGMITITFDNGAFYTIDLTAALTGWIQTLTAVTSIVITHGLNKLQPITVLYDSLGIQSEATITVINANSFTLTCNPAFTGFIRVF